MLIGTSQEKVRTLLRNVNYKEEVIEILKNKWKFQNLKITMTKKSQQVRKERETVTDELEHREGKSIAIIQANE